MTCFSKRYAITVCGVESFTVTNWKRKPPSSHKMAHVFRLSVMSFFCSFFFLFFFLERKSLMFGRKLQLSDFQISESILTPYLFTMSKLSYISNSLSLRTETYGISEHCGSDRTKKKARNWCRTCEQRYSVSQQWSNALLCGWSIAPLLRHLATVPD